jgi:multidrug efflux system membrane fusion protein
MTTFQRDPGTEVRSSVRPRSRSASPRGRYWIMGGVALILVLGAYWYFTSTAAHHADKSAGSTGAPVRVATVQRRDMPVIERSLGTVVANTMVQVVPRVSGTLEQQYFREGQFVNQGDRLFQIDPRPLQAALQQAEAVYKRDDAQLKNALLDKHRFETLQARGYASIQSRDAAVANADMLAASVAADQAAADQGRINLSYATIRSPISGKTGPVLVQPGNMVTGGAGSGAALVTIAQVRPVKVSFTLPEADLPRIQARQRAGPFTASLDVPTPSGDHLTAQVSFTSNAINPQSGTLELRANFPNADLSLVPGELVNVVVQLDTLKNALVVPRNAVNDSPSGPFVFVIRHKKAERQPVAVLFDDGTNTAVSGALEAGDQVVTEGQLRVTPGAAVHVVTTGGSGQVAPQPAQ